MPHQLSTARFYMTPKHAKKESKKIAITGEVCQWLCKSLTAFALWRVVMLIAMTIANPWAYWGYAFVAFVSCAWFAWILIRACFAALWQATSGYHERVHHRYLLGYVHDQTTWMDMAKGKFYTLWCFIEEKTEIVVIIVMIALSTAGFMFLLNSPSWYYSLPFSLVLAAILVFASIKMTFSGNHMEDHANQFGAHTDKVNKFYNIEEIKRLVPGATELETKTPAGTINQGEKVGKLKQGKGYDATAQFRTVDDNDDVVEMEDLPMRER